MELLFQIFQLLLDWTGLPFRDLEVKTTLILSFSSSPSAAMASLLITSSQSLPTTEIQLGQTHCMQCWNLCTAVLSMDSYMDIIGYYFESYAYSSCVSKAHG